MREIEVVIPVYNSEESIFELVDSICNELKKDFCDYRIILVDDRSSDNSWEKIVEVSKKYSVVKGVLLSKNFGQHKAITAGISITDSNYVVVMDCDLQDDPRYISSLIQKSNEGYDIVFTKKVKRNHSFFKNITANIFKAMFNILIGDKNQRYDELVGSYSLLTNKVVMAYKSIKDADRHYLMILRWLGFNHGYVEIDHKERKYGSSSYTLRKLLVHAKDGITSQSEKLLIYSVKLGMFLCLTSILAAVLIVIFYFLVGFKAGWPSIIVSILLSTGMILFALGVNGLYIGKCFEQSKNRPLFVVDKEVN